MNIHNMKMKSKNIFFVSILVITIMLMAQTSFAQLAPTSINFVPLPIGSGARALGQGGAFIAVADDATAASWNPGGLTQLERPEFSIVGSFLSTQDDFDPSNSDPSRRAAFNNQTVSREDLNFASIVYPFKILGKNFVASLNYQQIYDFHSEQEYKQKLNLSTSEKQFLQRKEEDFESQGGIGALTPAIAMQVLPKLSLGVAINVYTDEFFGNFAWRQTTNTRVHTFKKDINGVNKSTEFVTLNETFKNAQAVNATIGLLWNVWEKEDKSLTFGVVYDTPYTLNIDRVSEGSSVIHERRHFEIDTPMSFGAGLHFRCNDALCFSTDVTWTDWSSFIQKDEDGNKFRPLGVNTPKDRDISDTYSVKFGTEYLIFREKMVIPLRGGLFYDPRVSLDSPTDVYGVSVGSGITFKRFSIDAAYQYRWSTDVNGEDFVFSEKTDFPNTPFTIHEHMFLASLIVYF